MGRTRIGAGATGFDESAQHYVDSDGVNNGKHKDVTADSMQVTAQTSSTVPLRIKRAAGQTANLIEIVDENNNVLESFNSTGAFSGASEGGGGFTYSKVVKVAPASATGEDFTTVTAAINDVVVSHAYAQASAVGPYTNTNGINYYYSVEIGALQQVNIPNTVTSTADFVSAFNDSFATYLEPVTGLPFLLASNSGGKVKVEINPALWTGANSEFQWRGACFILGKTLSGEGPVFSEGTHSDVPVYTARVDAAGSILSDGIKIEVHGKIYETKNIIIPAQVCVVGAGGGSTLGPSSLVIDCNKNVPPISLSGINAGLRDISVIGKISFQEPSPVQLTGTAQKIIGTTLQGTGTSFTTELNVGDAVRTTGGSPYFQVLSVINDTTAVIYNASSFGAISSTTWERRATNAYHAYGLAVNVSGAFIENVTCTPYVESDGVLDILGNLPNDNAALGFGSTLIVDCLDTAPSVRIRNLFGGFGFSFSGAPSIQLCGGPVIVEDCSQPRQINFADSKTAAYSITGQLYNIYDAALASFDYKTVVKGYDNITTTFGVIASSIDNPSWTVSGTDTRTIFISKDQTWSGSGSFVSNSNANATVVYATPSFGAESVDANDVTYTPQSPLTFSSVKGALDEVAGYISTFTSNFNNITLDSLSDVVITTPGAGNTVKYNGTLAQWENQSIVTTSYATPIFGAGVSPGAATASSANFAYHGYLTKIEVDTNCPAYILELWDGDPTNVNSNKIFQTNIIDTFVFTAPNASKAPICRISTLDGTVYTKVRNLSSDQYNFYIAITADRFA